MRALLRSFLLWVLDGYVLRTAPTEQSASYDPIALDKIASEGK